ncbi:MAG: secondary thiamine-phosphate synthase enzyme YjbQ [Candidatus Saccharicenans sp.]|nr:secondary thiamine-phosphate synthase enzyme YjbQ [Candidatus Saccharicenans sp.]MDI6849462.1 secondary thiamine-phosphate synthase enzyme YjbQ [Candidatus Saccharicenans sp.]
MLQLNLLTSGREEFLNITGKIQALVRESGLRSGLAVIFCPHTTCGLTINEQADPEVRADILMALRKIVPDNLPWAHSEGNSPAHLKTSLLGSSLSVLIENGELVLGTWQGIFLCEFDGPRNRKVLVKLLESGKG